MKVIRAGACRPLILAGLMATATMAGLATSSAHTADNLGIGVGVPGTFAPPPPVYAPPVVAPPVAVAPYGYVGLGFGGWHGWQGGWDGHRGAGQDG
jgi:hypothetical protein